MHTFQLQVNAQPWTFDSSGKLKTAAGAAGTWTVVDNEIVTTVAGADKSIDDIVWGFNKANQLTLKQGAAVKAFDTGPDARPRIWVRDNQLMVDLDGEIETSGANFVFPLKANYGLDDKGDLVVKFKGSQEECVLDGFLEDDDSRFLFKFQDKQLSYYPHELTFNGKWDKTGDESEIRLRFHLTDPADEIQGKPLTLPGKVDVDKKRNHLVFSYVKNGEEKKLEFRGTIEIRKDWKVVFKITSASGGGVKSSSFELQTHFKWNATQTSLSLLVGKTETAAKQEITVGGKLLVKTVHGTTLQWDFAYNRSTSGGVVTTNLATSLEFVHKNGRLFIRYVKSGQQKQVEVVARLETVKYVFQGGIEVKDDPQGRRIAAFLGVSW